MTASTRMHGQLVWLHQKAIFHLSYNLFYTHTCVCKVCLAFHKLANRLSRLARSYKPLCMFLFLFHFVLFFPLFFVLFFLSHLLLSLFHPLPVLSSQFFLAFFPAHMEGISNLSLSPRHLWNLVLSCRQKGRKSPLNIYIIFLFQLWMKCLLEVAVITLKLSSTNAEYLYYFRAFRRRILCIFPDICSSVLAFVSNWNLDSNVKWTEGWPD